MLPDFKESYKAVVIKADGSGRKPTDRLSNQIREPRNKPRLTQPITGILVSLCFTLHTSQMCLLRLEGLGQCCIY